MKQQILAGCLSVTVLAGCGGGSTSGSLPNFEGLPASELFDQFADVDAQIDSLELLRSDTLDRSGFARHKGVLGLILDDSSAEGGAGEFVMSINLASGDVAGRAGNFSDFSEADAPGQLTLENGRLIRASAPRIEGDLTGTIDFDGGPETFDLEAEAAFIAPAGQATLGFINGTGRLQNGSTRDVTGAWFTEVE